MNRVWIDKEPHSYNLCDTSDKRHQIYFQFREEVSGSNRYGCLIPTDKIDLLYGCETPLEYAETLLQYGTGKLGHTFFFEHDWVPKIREIVDYLRKWDVRDQLEMNEKLRAELVEKLEKVDKRIARLKAEREEEIEEEKAVPSF